MKKELFMKNGVFSLEYDKETLRDMVIDLQTRWNSLKDWVFEHINSIEFNSYDDVLDKMNELEGKDKE